MLCFWHGDAIRFEGGGRTTEGNNTDFTKRSRRDVEKNLEKVWHQIQINSIPKRRLPHPAIALHVFLNSLWQSYDAPPFMISTYRDPHRLKLRHRNTRQYACPLPTRWHGFKTY